uniref:Gypsy retrotransposon integrase-like protein 1 n=1 Tax=Cyprinus carpio carpio TaxID=630221 RepID=A0A9J8A0T7_CYPCA
MKKSQKSQNPSSLTRLFVNPIQWDLDELLLEQSQHQPVPPTCPAGKIYVPEDHCTSLISSAHASVGKGHPGVSKTLTALQRKYWWPRMQEDIKEFIQGCALCAMTKVPRHLPTGKLLPLPIPHCPWSHIGLDFITNLPASDGNTCILVAIDRFSKACRLIPLKGLPTAFETAELLFNHVFRNFGIPEDIVSDRGPQFISRVWKSFLALLNVTVSLTSGYHPQANGQTERKIQDISRFLRTFCHRNQNLWNRYLVWAEYPQNSLRQTSTNLTPFQCILGYQPPLFPWSVEPSEVPAVNAWFRNSERVWNQAHHHLQRSVNRHQHFANIHRQQAPTYQPGQLVWLSTRDIRLRQPCRKLSSRYIGPFPVERQINPVTYRLQLPAQYRIHPTFHVSLLKPHHLPVSVPSADPVPDDNPPLPPIDTEPIYNVREILDSRRRVGRIEYLVDWEDYGPEERCWVPRQDILDPNLLTEFQAQHPERDPLRGPEADPHDVGEQGPLAQTLEGFLRNLRSLIPLRSLVSRMCRASTLNISSPTPKERTSISYPDCVALTFRLRTYSPEPHRSRSDRHRIRT